MMASSAAWNSLILDRDPLYTAAFRGRLRDTGVKPLLLPARSSNLTRLPSGLWGPSSPSAWTESCHSASNTSGPRSVRSWITITRNDRTEGLGNERIAPKTTLLGPGAVRCRERLGGVLRFYYREAA